MTRSRVGILISGRGSNMAALIYAAKADDCPFEISLVVSSNPDAPGLALAAAEGVATVALDTKGKSRATLDDAIHAALTGAACDHIALAGYMRLLSPAFVARWSGRLVNIHPSLLPAYSGLDTHARVLAAGERETGCTVHLVTDSLDSGEILGQTRVAVLPGDTSETLATRVLIAEHQLYPRILAAQVTRETGSDWLLAQVRSRALALPEAQEKLSHGMPAFQVGTGKMFAYFTYDHHHDGTTAIIVKSSGPEEAAMLIEQDPDLYYRPAYFGPAGWIGLRLDRSRPDWDHVADRLAKSWAIVAPPKLKRLAEFLG